MRVSVILVAAGSGQRLGFNHPKAFVKLAGEPILHHCLRVLAGVEAIVELVIAVPAGMESAARTEVRRTDIAVPAKLVPGGAERQDSVRAALAMTSAESDIVAVHDAARPFASAALFNRCIEAASRAGGAIAAIPVADTLKRVDNPPAINGTVARTGLWQAQTPQVFRRDLLIEAHRRAVQDSIAATDDADLVERHGGRVEIVEASAMNLKITTPADLEIAEALAARRMPS